MNEVVGAEARDLLRAPRYTLYPVTCTLSLEACQLRSTWPAPAGVAVRLPGLLGFSMSGTVALGGVARVGEMPGRVHGPDGVAVGAGRAPCVGERRRGAVHARDLRGASVDPVRGVTPTLSKLASQVSATLPLPDPDACRLPGFVGASVSGGTTLAVAALLKPEWLPAASSARTSYLCVAGARTGSE